ncbi:MAG: zinc ribbon domain-containing protein [Nitrospirae bacterium]|nr:zinc ribbon domain-containing protein [Nitrospirota bacterium]
MPLYEYLCEECGARFEKLVSSVTAPVVCAHCQSKRVKKQFSVFATNGAEARRETAPGPCNTCGSPEQGMCRYNA